jgi:hypothetical protein
MGVARTESIVLRSATVDLRNNAALLPCRLTSDFRRHYHSGKAARQYGYLHGPLQKIGANVVVPSACISGSGDNSFLNLAKIV